MKSTATFALAGAATLALSGVEAKPMHAGLDYHRYLQERDDTQIELAAWKTKFGAMASENGWVPVSEDRSIDEDEDHLQRFALTKQNIADMQAANPNANFSTDSPFSLLTLDEFAKFISGGYLAPNQTERRLHSWGRYQQGASSNTQGGSGNWWGGSGNTWGSSGNFRGHGGRRHGNDQDGGSAKTEVTTTSGSGKTTTTTTTRGSSSGISYTTTESTTTDGSDGGTSTSWSSTWSSYSWPQASGSGGFDWSKAISDWWNNAGTVEPAGPSSSDYTAAPAVTSAPAATTSAPAATASAPATTQRPRATTATPTSAPAATTSAPAATEETETASSPSTSSTTTSDVASDADSVDWSSTTCMNDIQYQGQCGDCWAFATISAVESAQCIAGGQKSIAKYSEQQLTSCDTQNYGCNGGAPQYAFDYIEQNGLCTESDYPFTSSGGSTGSCSTSCTKASTGITGYQSVNGADGLASAVAKQPVVVAVASANTAWKQYTGGVLSSCDTTTLDHAVVVVGYTDSEWKIRNSWGETWGEQGYVRLERSSDSTGVCGMYTDMSYPTTS